MTEAQKQKAIRAGFEDWTALDAAEVRRRLDESRKIALAKYAAAVTEIKARKIS